MDIFQMYFLFFFYFYFFNESTFKGYLLHVILYIKLYINFFLINRFGHN